MLMTLVMHLCSPCNRRTINFYDDDDVQHLIYSNRLSSGQHLYGVDADWDVLDEVAHWHSLANIVLTVAVQHYVKLL